MIEPTINDQLINHQRNPWSAHLRICLEGAGIQFSTKAAQELARDVPRLCALFGRRSLFLSQELAYP